MRTKTATLAALLALAAAASASAQNGTSDPLGTFPLVRCEPKPDCAVQGGGEEAEAIADPASIVRHVGSTCNASPYKPRTACGGPGPGDGYSHDTYWNCTFELAWDCWDPGTLDRGGAASHTYGWGQADNDDADADDLFVCVAAHLRGVSDYEFGLCDTNYAQDCLYDSCNDQDNYAYMEMRVFHLDDKRNRNVKGHGKA